jgi:hypothetical protein
MNILSADQVYKIGDSPFIFSGIRTYNLVDNKYITLDMDISPYPNGVYTYKLYKRNKKEDQERKQISIYEAADIAKREYSGKYKELEELEQYAIETSIFIVEFGATMIGIQYAIMMANISYMPDVDFAVPYIPERLPVSSQPPVSQPPVSQPPVRPQPVRPQPVSPPPFSPPPARPQPVSPPPVSPPPVSPPPARPQPAGPQPTNPQPTNPQPVDPSKYRVAA